MPRLFITRRAEDDIDEILTFILEDGFSASISFYEKILGQLRMLAENPEAGRLRPEINEGLRSFPFGSYLIFYRVWAGEVAIARIIHAARDLEEIFS